MDLSQTEENYIKSIYNLSDHGSKDVTTNAIAELLSTKPASVSDMLKKLAQKELVNYEKYKGVTLTTEGSKIALKIIRKHRLWEVFLVEELHFNWDEVHQIAEQLEHIKSPVLINKLDDFLGNPKFDPHGDPIPNEDGEFKEINQQLVAELPVGHVGAISGVKDTDSAFLKYLDKLGINLGTKIKVVDILEYDQSMEISLDDATSIVVSRDVSRNLYVKKTK